MPGRKQKKPYGPRSSTQVIIDGYVAVFRSTNPRLPAVQQMLSLSREIL